MLGECVWFGPFRSQSRHRVLPVTQRARAALRHGPDSLLGRRRLWGFDQRDPAAVVDAGPGPLPVLLSDHTTPRQRRPPPRCLRYQHGKKL